MAAFLINVKKINEFTFDQLFKEMTDQFHIHNFLKNIKIEPVQLAWEKLITLNFLIPNLKEKSKFAFTLFAEDLADFISIMPTDHQKWIKTWI